MESFYKKFGQKVKFYRNVKDYTQEELASIIGVATSTISAWENGKALITKTHLIELCKVLSIAPEDLFSFVSSSYKTDNKNLKEIVNLAEQLSPDKQLQVIAILKTFI